MTKSKFDITKEIKEHEKKYTIILVILFILILVFVGYYILSIDNKKLNTSNKTINYKYSSLSNSSRTITLTNNNILDDKDGLNTNKISINIKNTTDSKYDYKIVLKDDKSALKTCNCENDKEIYKYIKYSLNGKSVLTLSEDMVIYKGSLNQDKEKEILINIWLDKSLNTSNYQYHGYFSIEKTNQD